MRRKIRESIEIRTRHPAINRDQGYELPPIYDELLSCDRRSGSHVTSEDYLNPPDEMAVMVTQASNHATLLTLMNYLITIC